MGEKRNVYGLLIRKSAGKRALGRPRRRWVDNVKMDLGQTGVVWIAFAWFRIGTGGELL
jgi:hypothetical protein